VIVPNEISLQLHDLKLIVIHFSHDLRLPLLVEQRELLAEVDCLVTHASSPSVIVYVVRINSKEQVKGSFGSKNAKY
jgi:hypothetical protein